MRTRGAGPIADRPMPAAAAHPSAHDLSPSFLDDCTVDLGLLDHDVARRPHEGSHRGVRL